MVVPKNLHFYDFGIFEPATKPQNQYHSSSETPRHLKQIKVPSHGRLHTGGAASGRPPLCGMLCGYVATWLCGSVAMSLCSYLAIWLCGYVAIPNSSFVIIKKSGILNFKNSKSGQLRFQKLRNS